MTEHDEQPHDTNDNNENQDNDSPRGHDHGNDNAYDHGHDDGYDDGRVAVCGGRSCIFYAHVAAERDQLRYHYDYAVKKVADATAAAWAAVGAMVDGERDAWRYIVEEFIGPPTGHPIAFLWPDDDEHRLRMPPPDRRAGGDGR